MHSSVRDSHTFVLQFPSMNDESKTRTCTVRLTPATWTRTEHRARELGIPPTRLIELATRAFLGEPVAAHHKALAEALSAVNKST